MGKKGTKKDEAVDEENAGETAIEDVEVLPEETAKEVARYDLSARMTPFMDKHMVLLMLGFARDSGVYKPEAVARAELELLSRMDLIEYERDKYKLIGEPVPDSLDDRKDNVLENLTESRTTVMPLLHLLEDEDMVKKIPNFKTMDQLCTEFQIDIMVVNELLRYAKMQYDLGNYEISGAILKHYRSMPKAGAADGSGQPEALSARDLSCMWGCLASALLVRDFEEATRLIFELDEALNTFPAPKREILIQRTWLLHWTLFAIFSADKADPKLLMDFFLNEKSLSIISLSCPHLFRYVGACLILQKRLKHLVKETVWIIHHEQASYSDPVTRFLLALYTEMDYDDAQQELQRCGQVCRYDYFLAQHWPDFQENARLHVFESYCRIHQCINIQMIATKLNMQAEEAELWIVKLIQNAKLDARIDSEKSRVVMTKAPPNVYQQVIEKTKNLAFRSTMLVSNLEKDGKPKDGRL